MNFDKYGEPLEKEPIKFIAEIDSVGTTRDGGFKVVLIFGANDMEAAQKMMMIKSVENSLLAIAAVPYIEPK